MQTFLPYADFQESAHCLDRMRLGKQRVESYQILKVLLGFSKPNKKGIIAWSNHPAVKMWKGYEVALLWYTLAICKEWTDRNYKDTIREKSLDLFHQKHYDFDKLIYDNHEVPDWLGNQQFHDSHKSNLLRKNKEYYSRFEWSTPDDLPYIWPTNTLDF